MNKLRVFIFILAGLTGLLLVAYGMVQAGVLAPPVGVDIQPPPNSIWADVGTSISITYDQDMNPATVDPHSFAVHARQTGWLTETLSVVSGTIALDPLHPFHAGELVQVSATTATLSLGGEAPLAPTVWQFNTSPWGGNAAFHEKQVFGDDDYSRKVALGDLDGDGDLDAITVNCGFRTRIYHNNGSGTFTEVQNYNHIIYCMVDAELGDLDGDGDLDALLVDSREPGLNLTLLNDGTGHFTEGSQLVSYTDCYGDLGDLDGDGDLDLFVASGGFSAGTLRVWKNNGKGVFTLAHEFDTAYNHLDVALGDLDSDGDLDAFTTGWNNTYNKVWLNDGTGAFIESQVIPNANTYGVQLGDLDSDGDLDAYLVNTNTAFGNLPDEVWLNDGTGHFTDSGQRLDAVNSAYPALGDLDADGDLDVYLAAGVVVGLPDEVWANDGMGTFTHFRTVDENYPGGGATLGDLDGDGNLDAFVFGHNVLIADGFQVYLNGDWTQAESILDPISRATTIRCPDDPNGFYILGGYDETADRFSHYDADLDQWTVLASIPITAYEPAAACYDEKIYAADEWGFYIYDITSETWVAGPTPPRQISGSATGAWNGSLYVVGGVDFSPEVQPDPRISRFDLASQTWTLEIGTMPTPVWAAGWVQVGPYLYVAGGTLGWDNPNTAETYRYDMSANTWERGPDLPTPRQISGLVATGSRLYVLGGMDVDFFDEVFYQELSSWPNAAWTDLNDPLPLRTAGMNTACTEAFTGGEIWSAGGWAFDVFDNIYTGSNLYYPAEPCLGNTYAFVLGPESQSGQGYRGQELAYTLRVTNTGELPDAYTLTYTSTWSLEAPQVIGAVDPGETVSFVITLTVPLDASFSDINLAEITLTSQGDPAQVDLASVDTTVIPRRGVSLEPPSLEGDGYPGETISYTLTLTNTGDLTDTFEVSFEGNLWQVTVPITSFKLAAGETVDVVVYVTVAGDAWPGEQDMVTITATSQGDPGISAQVELTTTAEYWQVFLPVIRK